MAVYVDDLMEHGAPGLYRGKDAAQAQRVGARNGNRWCHLFTDEADRAFPELHAFAKRIGMRRSWFQGDHYDLTPGRRAAAVRAGAREVTRKEAVEVWGRTPRARRRRCRVCGYVTERTVEPLPRCPKCGTERYASPAGGGS